MVDRDRARQLIGNERSASFKGETSTSLAALVGFGSLAAAQRAAGGAEAGMYVNTALLLLVDSDRLLRIISQPPAQRADILLRMLREDNDQVTWAEIGLLSRRSDKLLQSSRVVGFQEEEANFLNRGFSVEAAMEEKQGKLMGDSAAGRCGNFDTLAGLPGNIHFGTFATVATLGARRRGDQHAGHLMIAAPSDGNRDHLLMIYAGGPNAQRSPLQSSRNHSHSVEPRTRKCDRDKVANASTSALRYSSTIRAAYADKEDTPLSAYCGEPRTFLLTAGRNFAKVTRSQNRRLHMIGGPVSQQENAMAEAALESQLLISALNLAPSGASPELPQIGDANGSGLSESSRGKRKLRAACLNAPKPSSCASHYQAVLGDGVSRTVSFTWDVAAKCETLHDLISALAAIKGYYRNMYPGFWHKDSDQFMETWVLMQSHFSMQHAMSLGVTRPAPTLCPQLGIKVEPDVNLMVVTALFQRLWHATGEAVRMDCAAELTSSQRASLGRSACESFLLQSRGRRESFLVPVR